MSYEKHEWVNNETITAAKLNNIEDGIEEAAQSGGGGALIVTYDDGEGQLDKTAQEIYDAITSGTPAYFKYSYGTTSTYSSRYRLAPIIAVYCYAYTDDIRVVISHTSYKNITGVGDNDTPAILIFKAYSMNEYPTYFRTVEIASNALEANQNGM